ncbi:MAG: cytochrome c [Flammeovirgaceae bacterium]|nr:cytochrome c [Flammeovirgaceae bacterium]
MSRVLLFLTFVLSLTSCHKKGSGESVKFEQYYVQGEQLYMTHCSNCHQVDGSGLGLLYPPIKESDFMDRNFEEVLCMMKNGRSGEITVNGKVFNQPMPGVPTLTNLEIAEIATYIYNTWDHKRGIVEVTSVNPIMENCQ